MSRRVDPGALRLASWGALAAGALWACFTPPDIPPGPYRCNSDGGCGEDARLACVEGLCCNPNGEPVCPSRQDSGPNPPGDGGPDSGAPDGGDGGTDAGCMVPAPDDCGTGASGRCGPGKWTCDAGALFCRPTATPLPEICNAEDDDCNGATDERPGCGGPPNLLGPGGPASEIVTGAQRTNVGLSSLRVNCIKDLGGNVAEPWDGGTWTGLFGGSDAFSYSHIVYAEPADGGVWDLGGRGHKLTLAFGGQLNDPASPPIGYPQPQVFLCSPTGEARRYFPRGFDTVLTFGGGNTMNMSGEIYLGDGGPAWGFQSHVAFSINQVRRVEVHLAPATQAGVQPSFNVTFSRWGFAP